MRSISAGSCLVIIFVFSRFCIRLFFGSVVLSRLVTENAVVSYRDDKRERGCEEWRIM